MALRREIRLRKEYLEKKQRVAISTIRDEKKRKLKNALDNNKSIPTEIVADSRKLNHEIEMDLNPLPDKKAWYDDEYANIGLVEPKVCITTSRDPSSRLKQFSK